MISINRNLIAIFLHLIVIILLTLALRDFEIIHPERDGTAFWIVVGSMIVVMLNAISLAINAAIVVARINRIDKKL